MRFLKTRAPTQIGKIVREVMHIQLNCMYSSLNNPVILYSPRPCYFASFILAISAWFETKHILKLHICILMSFAVCLSKIIWDTFFSTYITFGYATGLKFKIYYLRTSFKYVLWTQVFWHSVICFVFSPGYQRKPNISHLFPLETCITSIMQHHQTLPERLLCKRERKNKTDFLKGKELFSLSESYFLFLSN